MALLPGRAEKLVSSATRTANGAVELEELEAQVLQPASASRFADKLRVQLDVTAASGVGQTLDVVVEDTIDGTNWNTVRAFAQKTAVGREVINITEPFSKNLRIRWTINGTNPSFTFSIDGLGR